MLVARNFAVGAGGFGGDTVGGKDCLFVFDVLFEFVEVVLAYFMDGPKGGDILFLQVLLRGCLVAG